MQRAMPRTSLGRWARAPLFSTQLKPLYAQHKSRDIKSRVTDTFNKPDDEAQPFLGKRRKSVLFLVSPWLAAGGIA